MMTRKVMCIEPITSVTLMRVTSQHAETPSARYSGCYAGTVASLCRVGQDWVAQVVIAKLHYLRCPHTF